MSTSYVLLTILVVVIVLAAYVAWYCATNAPINEDFDSRIPPEEFGDN